MVLVRPGKRERELEDPAPRGLRAAQLGSTVRATVSQSWASPGFAVSHAVLVMDPFAVGFRTTCTVADAFLRSVPARVHVTVSFVFDEHVHDPDTELAETYPAFLVNVSTTFTPVASAGPLFATVMLNHRARREWMRWTSPLPTNRPARPRRPRRGRPGAICRTRPSRELESWFPSPPAG
jgi:hypothetical protein